MKNVIRKRGIAKEMVDGEKRIWGIHTQDDNLFLKKGKIAIGWREMGDLSVIKDNREAFKVKYQSTYPDAKKGSIPTGSGIRILILLKLKEEKVGKALLQRRRMAGFY